MTRLKINLGVLIILPLSADLICGILEACFTREEWLAPLGGISQLRIAAMLSNPSLSIVQKLLLKF